MSLAECIGQDQAINQVNRARKNGRLGHCMVFHGPEGVGKFLLSKQLSKLLLCHQPVLNRFDQKTEPIEDSCDSCPDCHLVESNNHPDFQIVTKELVKFTDKERSSKMKYLPVDVIREFVVNQAGAKPSRGRARVFVIDGAEDMNLAAQNALLKTLEEPPPDTYIIMITPQPERLLPTVRSRSHMVRFKSLPELFIRQRLEEFGIGAAQAAYWSGFSGGRLGVALRLARGPWYDIKCSLVDQLANLSYPTVREQAGWLVDQAKDYGEKEGKEQAEGSKSELVRQGQDYLLELQAETFRSAIRVQSGLDALIDQTDLIRRIGDRFGVLGCSQAIRQSGAARRYLQANVSPPLLFEWLMLEYLNCARG